MGKVIIGMTMSLDGFINDRNGGVGLLYPDLAALQAQTRLQDAIRDTGAVVMGRNAYAMGDPDSYVDSYEFQVPIFVLTHQPPERIPKQSDRLTFTFVTDGVSNAIEQAKVAAGDKNVMVIGGASTFQQCLNAGLFDELQIDVRHIILGGGQRLFGDLHEGPIELESLGVEETSGITHLTYRRAGSA